MSWTSPKTWSPAVVSVADLNTHIRDNFLYLCSTLGILNISNFGDHAVSAGGTGPQRLIVRNTTSGAANLAEMLAVAGTNTLEIAALSQGYTTSGAFVQAGCIVLADSVGGLSLGASHASGDVRVYSRNALAATFGASQAATFTGQVTVPSGSSGTFAWGVYTPTLTNTTNIDSSTPFECQYMRVGNTVTVSGKVSIDPTSGSTSTHLGITLPIASNFGAQEDLGGTATAIAETGGQFQADTVNDRASLFFWSTATSSVTWSFIFMYQVI